MAGPNSFFINGPSFADVGFDRAIAGYGFNYERGVAEMIHDLGHRTENHGQRAFGGWNLAIPGDGLGPLHRQLSGNRCRSLRRRHLPCARQRRRPLRLRRHRAASPATACDFANYPGLTGAATTVGRDTWACGPHPDYHRDYLNWYFAMMPRNDGTAADGHVANWYKYIWDFNSYEAGTGLARGEDAFGAAPIVRRSGAAEF